MACRMGSRRQQPRGVAELPDQPALRQHLHPRADGGETGARPHQSEIAVLKSLEDPAEHKPLLSLTQQGPQGEVYNYHGHRKPGQQQQRGPQSG